MRAFRILATFLGILAFSSIAMAQSPTLTREQNNQLAVLKAQVVALADNAVAGIITKEQAAKGINRYLEQAATVAGREVTLEELLLVEYQDVRISGFQKFAGLVTWVNILWVLAIGVGVSCFCYLFGSYVMQLVELFKDIPPAFYEFLLYAGSVVLGLWGRNLSPNIAPFIGLTACLLFGGGVILSAELHKKKFLNKPFNISTIFFVVWTVAALIYQSQMIGFIAVIAFMGMLGFSVIVSPLCYCIGFENEDHLGKATTASFMLLAAYVAMRVTGVTVPYTEVFEKGALFMGSFVGYLGLLIASSRWYNESRRFGWIASQIITIGAGLAALYLGSKYQISELQKIGGTFFVLYLLEKPAEIPVESGRAYATIGLVIAGMLYWFCVFFKSHPQYFIF